MTVLEVLQSTTDYFKKRGIESPRLNTEQLLAHVLERKRIELYLEFERVLTEAELAPLRELVKRRGQGEPLQHLLGTVEFCGKIFVCDKRALIPRTETEELVEMIKSRIENRESSILDVGTGSGVIAVTLALHFPGAAIHAIDISPDALNLARENAERFGVAERIHFVNADLLAGATDPFEADLQGQQPAGTQPGRGIFHQTPDQFVAAIPAEKRHFRIVQNLPGKIRAIGPRDVRQIGHDDLKCAGRAG